MRMFILIFSLVFLALAVFPCNDISGYDISDSNTSIESNIAHNTQDSDKDHCSPFCICACCGQSFSTIVYISGLSIYPCIESNEITNYKSSNVMEVSLSIWQPPKIVS